MDKTKQRAVLVGCGGICKAWLKPIKEFADVEIVGLVDLDMERCTAINDEFELGAVVGTGQAQVIRATNATMVFDCTVPEAHSTVALTAFENGCHVLSEKPLAATMEEAVSVVNAAERSGKLYAVIQNRRYLDSIIAYRDAIRSDDMGPVTTLNADFYLGPHFGGFREEMDHVLLLDMSIHTFDQARFISGQTPVSVYCHEWNPSGSWFTHGASAIAIFEMDGGVVFTYRGSWCASGLPTSWQADWRAVCERGTVKWDGEGSVSAEFLIDGGKVGFFPEVRDVPRTVEETLEHTSHAGVIREFLDCLATNTLPQTHGKDNIQSLAMVHAAIKSAGDGRKVMISEVMKG